MAEKNDKSEGVNNKNEGINDPKEKKDNKIDYKTELDDLKGKYDEIIKKTAMQEELLKKMDLIVAKELDDVDKNSDEKVDTKSLFDSIMEKKTKEEIEIKKELELQKAKDIAEENKRLKLELGITKIIEKEPYLKEYVEEGIEKSLFNSLEDIEKNLTTSMKEALKYKYEINEKLKNGGGDPLKDYLKLADGEKKNERELRRKESLEKWAKKLSR